MKINLKFNTLMIIITLTIIMIQFSYSQDSEKINEESISKKWLDINYAGDSLTGHLLDIYLPTRGNAPYPVIITVAGSAFFSDSSKHWAFGLGKIMLEHGFALVTANHRSSTKAKFPAHVNDIKGVIRYIRANTSKYNLDTTFIGIAGNSSGGNLAAMIGTSGGIKNYTINDETVDIEGEVYGNTQESSRVDAVVDWYGPTTFLKMDSCGSKMLHDAADSPESIYIGGPIQDNPELCALADPITYVDENDPPFLILHGDADPLVPLCQSVLLYESLKTHSVQSEMITVSGGGHGGSWEDNYREKMFIFFKSVRDNKQKNQ